MNRQDRLAPLDGLRGAMCLWVVIGHTCRQTGMRIPVLSSPHYAVDGFMILSGFLMTYHALLRSGKEPWTEGTTWLSFYIRRFFRISPLYYLLLIPAYLFGDSLAHWRQATDVALGISHPFGSIRAFSWPNLEWHLSYLFGLLPNYHASTALPDWSLSLEMQFYLLFPMFMLISRRFGWIAFALASTAIWFATSRLLHGFEQPSPLPLSLVWFAIGMVWAVAFLESNCYLALFAGSLSLPSADPHDVALVAVFGWVLFAEGRASLGRSAGFIREQLSGRVSSLLARASYSVYLLHLLVLTPIAYFLVAYLHLGRGLRFFLALGATLIFSYGLARPLEGIENWGIRRGKDWSKRLITAAKREPSQLSKSSLVESHPLYRPLSS